MSKLAIHGGAPTRTTPFSPWPLYDEQETAALEQTLASRSWTSSPYQGDEIPARRFAERFAAYHETRYGVATSSGTGALQIAFAAAGIRPGDEVIVPPNTFIATVTPILHLGAIPIFVDIEAETLNLDPDAVEAAITPRTRAIVPLHLAGYPCDMDGISAVAARHGLRVIADACHAHGAEWKGVKVAALSDLAAFSFQQGKNITAGEGGATVTNDRELFELCFMYHNDGRGLRERMDYYEVQGWNFRLSAFQAALLSVQLERLDEWLKRKAEAVAYIAHGLSEVEGLRFPNTDPRMTRISYLYPRLAYDAAAFGGVTLERFTEALHAEGLPVAAGRANPLYKHPLFLEKRFFYDEIKRVDYSQVRCPVAESAPAQSILFNHSVLLSDRAAISKVADQIDALRA
ncbi:MAG TPA: DegT/DnrJ/EryC1/StrS family aminotransferase [Caldilineaceae bacterium]|nr:DegT/DnrJ/EryC1/StrS family aminotransferase [Caldilineaceae bacterium]